MVLGELHEGHCIDSMLMRLEFYHNRMVKYFYSNRMVFCKGNDEITP
jgi:hypothetical protein